MDGSDPSLQAVQMALRMVAVSPTCKMTVVHVIEKLVLNELVRFSKRNEKEVELELEEQGRRYLDFARKDAQRQGVEIECQIRRGDPFEEVIAIARELGADLIVMGHTGRRGTSRVLIGSVTERVLDYAPCPVLVMRCAAS